VYIYYGGYARRHKGERFTERQLGRVRIKKDRYVAREAQDAGVMRTRLVRLAGQALTLNVDAEGGEVRARLLDEGGKPLKGFGFKDCAPINSNELAAPLRWKRPLSEAATRPVLLEF